MRWLPSLLKGSLDRPTFDRGGTLVPPWEPMGQADTIIAKDAP